jgi:signal transduction histidine kinase
LDNTTWNDWVGGDKRQSQKKDGDGKKARPRATSQGKSEQVKRFAKKPQKKSSTANVTARQADTKKPQKPTQGSEPRRPSLKSGTAPLTRPSTEAGLASVAVLESKNEELRHTQLDLQDARVRYRVLYDFSPVGLLTLNMHEKILEGNLAAWKLLHGKEKAVVSQKLESFVTAGDRAILRRHLRRVKQGKEKEISDVIRLKHKQTPHYVQLKSFYVEPDRQTPEIHIQVALINLTAEQKAKTALEHLSARLLTAQEDERRRIARELHDDMNQRLAVVAFRLQAAQKEVSPSAAIQSTLQSLYVEVSSLSDNVRHLAYQLHPSVLVDLGLETALRSLLADFSKVNEIPTTFTGENVPRFLSQHTATCLYRVTQESLRNVAKHAEASKIAVTLIRKDGGIKLASTDDGKGFNGETVREKQQGLGLVGMKERVRLCHGVYQVESHLDQGTTIHVWVPLE